VIGDAVAERPRFRSRTESVNRAGDVEAKDERIAPSRVTPAREFIVDRIEADRVNADAQFSRPGFWERGFTDPKMFKGTGAIK
jgi:hypothetical protein